MNSTRPLQLSFLILLVLLSAGCEVIGDIFQAGMVVGVILVLLVIGVAVFLIAKVRG